MIRRPLNREKFSKENHDADTRIIFKSLWLSRLELSSQNNCGKG